MGNSRNIIWNLSTTAQYFVRLLTPIAYLEYTDGQNSFIITFSKDIILKSFRVIIFVSIKSVIVSECVHYTEYMTLIFETTNFPK